MTSDPLNDDPCAGHDLVALAEGRLPDAAREALWVHLDGCASCAEVVAHRAAQDFFQRSPRHSSISFGVVVWDGKSTASVLLDQADSRMYQSRFGSAWVRQPAETREGVPTATRR